ncbi:MAG: DUF4040 domain-containing protein [Lachnospiraceae bacterium]|jgi:uncharacterized MnhB-related membrane protein|nr:DUF4040 domain-containing protein [Lachnospiraceae bacterium]
MNVMILLNTLVIIGILVTAVCAVMFENILSSVIALGVTGALMALEFILLQAPDVAIAEAAVGAVLSTAIFVIAVKKTTPKEEEEK